MKSKHPFVQLGLFSSSTTCKFKNTRTTLDVLEIKYYRKKKQHKTRKAVNKLEASWGGKIKETEVIKCNTL